jgi:endoglucanase
LTAKATDNIGASTTSSAIVVIVNDKVNNVPPTVAITSPASGANFITGASIAIRATASDADGSVSKVEFFNNGSKLGEDASVPYEYTISGAAKGTYNLTAKATDNGGASATSSSVAINVNDGTPPPPGSCSFGTPIANPLPSFNRADFSRVYVLGSNGPDVINIRRFRINWNASVKGLYQFAVNTKNGTPAFYIDLRNSLTHSFNAARPDVKISGSGLPGFDGDYWVTKNGDNFVMVSKTRGFTLYFTNASTAPACSNSSRIGSEADNGLVLKATPLPVLGNTMNLTWAGAEGVLQLEIADFSGRTLIQKTINSNANTATLDVSSLAAGTYIATLKGKDTFSKLVFTRQ